MQDKPIKPIQDDTPEPQFDPVPVEEEDDDLAFDPDVELPGVLPSESVEADIDDDGGAFDHPEKTV